MRKYPGVTMRIVADGNCDRGTTGVLRTWNLVPALGAPTTGRLLAAAADSTPAARGSHDRIAKERSRSLGRILRRRYLTLIVTSPAGRIRG